MEQRKYKITPNVHAFELGITLILGKKCMDLQHKKLQCYWREIRLVLLCRDQAILGMLQFFHVYTHSHKDEATFHSVKFCLQFPE